MSAHVVYCCSFGPFDEIHRLTSPKVRTLLEFPYRQDQSEVCTLSGRVSPRLRPYPPHYRAAFASSDLFYPLLRPPSLQSGYHRGGEHRAYPVVDEDVCGPVRLESVPRWACRMSSLAVSYAPTSAAASGSRGAWAFGAQHRQRDKRGGNMDSPEDTVQLVMWSQEIRPASSLREPL